VLTKLPVYQFVDQ